MPEPHTPPTDDEIIQAEQKLKRAVDELNRAAGLAPVLAPGAKMPTHDAASPFPLVVEPVPFWINSERLVYLAYSIRTIQRLKKRLGQPLTGLNALLMKIDEDLLPVLVHEGLCDENGAPLDPPITLEEIEQLPAAMYGYLLETFNHAWNGHMPEKKRRRLIEAANREAALATNDES